MRRQKCSDLFRGITTRLPFWEEAKVKGEWSFKRKKHLLEAAILPYGDGRDTVHALVTSHMYTHIHTHTISSSPESVMTKTDSFGRV